MKEGLEKAADNLAQVFGNAFERLAETGRFTFGDFIRDLNRLIIRSTSELLQQELSNMLHDAGHVKRWSRFADLQNIHIDPRGRQLPGFPCQRWCGDAVA